MVYSIFSYGAMMADKIRMDAYREALKHTVKKECVVLDLGAGQGICSLIACEFGAARVYAVEPSDVISVAKDCARANGFGDRIQFIQERSEKVELPEQMDVIVSDMRGVLPIYGKHFSSIIDARQRFLKPGGMLIPQRDKVFACLVNAEKERERLLHGYAQSVCGFDFAPALKVAANELWKVEATAEQQMSEAALLFEICYPSLNREDLDGTLHFTMERNGRVDGALLWFETELQPGIGFSTGPLCPKTIYGQGVLPWPEPMELVSGDKVDMAISIKQMGQDPFWRWQTKIRRDGRVIHEMDQSLLPAMMLSKDRLRKTIVC